jgi:hypothetical protein
MQIQYGHGDLRGARVVRLQAVIQPLQLARDVFLLADLVGL